MRRRADEKAHQPAAETLALAFTDDPLMAWLFDDDARRTEQLRHWWAWIIANRQPHVDLLTTDDDRAAALWHGPDPVEGKAPHTSFPEMLAGLIGAEEMARKLPALGVIPAAHPTERHWYLAAIGTRPEFQGNGDGTRLMLPVLGECDAEGIPAYLESSNPRNIPFYERLGFVATGTIQVPEGGPALTPMWREPRRGADA